MSKRLHFNSLSDALQVLDQRFDTLLIDHNLKIYEYKKEINYNSGGTLHYNSSRIFREKELVRLLGKGKRVIAFVVNESDENIQIQEILNNGVLVVYSFNTHKKITIFAPKPERIMSLFFSIGRFPPDWLIEKANENMREGYNMLYL